LVARPPARDAEASAAKQSNSAGFRRNPKAGRNTFDRMPL
jgi:hypothetical protein